MNIKKNRKYTNGSKLYSVWANMKKRCLNNRHPMYKHYGGRGITLDYSWLKYDGFEKDMLSSFEDAMNNIVFDKNRKRINVSLDRIDNSKSYSKENCRWTNQKEQCKNRRIPENWGTIIDGERKSYANICKEHGINLGSFMWRIHHGYSFEEATKIPYGSGYCKRNPNYRGKFNNKIYQQEYYLRVTLPKRKMRQAEKKMLKYT